ncbi:hypothetical protein [Stenotrophomonas sp.]|uniref:hypothetical protein n=1 Tax=Stenotrophomonas sp. TaxID=69392 RepID=UPI0028A645FB|nr:hypothetical protein [Stenotrophomonas sp.]
MSSFYYDLAMALIPGTIAGYYSGLLMAKVNKFNSLKFEALRVVRSINYLGDSKNTSVTRSEKTQDLHLIASELLMFKHQKSGMKVMAISNDVLDTLAACEFAPYDVALFEKQIAKWQLTLRGIKPSARLLLPWGQI